MADINSKNGGARAPGHPIVPPHGPSLHAGAQRGYPMPTGHLPTEDGLDPLAGGPNHQEEGTQMTGSSDETFAPRHSQFAQSAWAGTTNVQTARHATTPSYGTSQNQPTAPETSKAGCSIKVDRSYVGISSVLVGVPAKDTTMNAQVAEIPPMVPKTAPAVNRLRARQKNRAVTPYKAEGWRDLLSLHGLLSKYPDIPNQLIHGLMVRAPVISHSFTPPNNPSIDLHRDAFNSIVAKEFEKNRYLGPFSRSELESTLGFFQSSPMSIIPKAGKPGRFRLIQNLSYPNVPSHHGFQSINSQVNSDLFPCTWGTFSTACTLIYSLPPGCQGATRDVAEAYRTIPLHPSQWPALVVRIGENPPTFAVDTALCFGYGPSAGTYGALRDASLDVMRAAGIGPIIAWVDDHLFIRLPHSTIIEYNKIRARQAQVISTNGGPLLDGGRLWYKGAILADGTCEEFAEDCLFPIKNFTTHPESGTNTESHAFAFEHINDISDRLGIPWEPSKDSDFSSKPVFMGFEWDLDQKTVSLTQGKCDKYISAIKNWLCSTAHTLEETQKLHGRLTHASLVIPEGSAYLASLQAMLGIFGDNPFMPRRQPRGTTHELQWWLRALCARSPLPIPHHPSALDLGAYSDASSGHGLAIVIGDKWRAWRLHRDWKFDERDIGWAESVAFEFLVQTLLTINKSSTPLTVYGDNQGVIEAWRKGRSRNKPTNSSFKRIHAFLASPPRRVFAKYIPSGDNPADGPSRGKYPPPELTLPRIRIPTEIAPFVFDFDDPRCDRLCIQR